jgi:hypothetical protein
MGPSPQCGASVEELDPTPNSTGEAGATQLAARRHAADQHQRGAAEPHPQLYRRGGRDSSRAATRPPPPRAPPGPGAWRACLRPVPRRVQAARIRLVLEPGRQGAPVCSTCPGNRDAACATCPAGTHRKDTQIDCACASCPAGEHNPHAATNATNLFSSQGARARPSARRAPATATPHAPRAWWARTARTHRSTARAPTARPASTTRTPRRARRAAAPAATGAPSTRAARVPGSSKRTWDGGRGTWRRTAGRMMRSPKSGWAPTL